MDFKEFKKGAISFKDKLSKKIDEGVDFSTQKFNDAVEYSAKKLGEKAIREKSEIDEFLKKSEETLFTNKDSGETKIFKHKVVIIFGDEKSDFFKDYLIKLPIIRSKAFTSGIKIKLAISKIVGVNLEEDYGVKKLPCMVVFQDKEVYKLISGKKSIEKIIKSFKMDIEKDIEDFKN